MVDPLAVIYYTLFPYTYNTLIHTHISCNDVYLHKIVFIMRLYAGTHVAGYPVFCVLKLFTIGQQQQNLTALFIFATAAEKRYMNEKKNS